MNGDAKIEGRDAVDSGWTDGNCFQLLENGEEYFPAVFAAIAAARHEVLIETFILFEDAVGRELQNVLIAAGRRGVSIDLTVDGYGSPDLSDAFISSLTAAGVRLHIFDPRRRLFGLRTNIFRRMHRKIVSVDGVTAFVGGINFSVDQLIESDAQAKQDYALRIQGPLAEEIHCFARAQAGMFNRQRPHWWSVHSNRAPHALARETVGKALFVTRDNLKHRDDIERHYRIAIRAAKRDIIIANAYFFPGYRLLKQLRRAARRGVGVKLILQGQPDMPYVKTWARMLYAPLLQAGVEIYEYCRCPLHAKVAVVDEDWSTVGSSNLDPLSLALNLEANVMIRDPAFNAELRACLQRLLEEYCQRIDARSASPRTAWHMLIHTLAFHCTRHFPVWAGWLPAHTPRLRSIGPAEREPKTSHESWAH